MISVTKQRPEKKTVLPGVKEDKMHYTELWLSVNEPECRRCMCRPLSDPEDWGAQAPQVWPETIQFRGLRCSLVIRHHLPALHRWGPGSDFQCHKNQMNQFSIKPKEYSKVFVNTDTILPFEGTNLHTHLKLITYKWSLRIAYNVYSQQFHYKRQNLLQYSKIGWLN